MEREAVLKTFGDQSWFKTILGVPGDFVTPPQTRSPEVTGHEGGSVQVWDFQEEPKSFSGRKPRNWTLREVRNTSSYFRSSRLQTSSLFLLVVQ